MTPLGNGTRKMRTPKSAFGLGREIPLTNAVSRCSPFQAREEQAFPPEPSASETIGGIVPRAFGFLSVRPRGSEISKRFYARSPALANGLPGARGGLAVPSVCNEYDKVAGRCGYSFLARAARAPCWHNCWRARVTRCGAATAIQSALDRFSARKARSKSAKRTPVICGLSCAQRAAAT